MNKRNLELKERLIRFACLCLKIAGGLQETIAEKHISTQLIRSGSSPALHYGETFGAESRKDFVHKMKICLKELHESYNCIQLIEHMGWGNRELIQAALSEGNQLIAIFTTSIKTALANIENSRI